MAKEKMQKIIIADIRKYHPKMLGECPTDRDYAAVANDLLAILEPKKSMMPAGIDIRDMAIRLALYLEDVISDGPTWRTFIFLCRKLYGSTLPFFPEEDAPKEFQEHYEGDVNFDDVRMLLWIMIQRTKLGDTLINPHTPGLAMIAADVFDYMYENFEKQPINPLLNAAFDVLPTNPYDRFMHYRSLMTWILTGNYLLTSADIKTELENKRKLIEAYFPGEKDKGIIEYAALVEAVFTVVCGPLSLYPKQWLAAMLKISDVSAKKDATQVDAIEFKEIDLYNIESTDSEYIYLKDCYDESYKVAKHSFASLRGLKDCSNVITSLVKFQQSCYYINGSAQLMQEGPSMREWRQMREKERYGTALDHDKAQLLSKEQYINFFGGKRHKFFASQRELVKCITPKEQLHNQNEKYMQLLNETDDETPIFVYVCDDGQLYISEYLADLIPARDNPFRVKSPEAEAEFFCAVMGNEIEPEVIQYIIDKGWAKKLAMNSIKGKKQGAKLLQENISFLNRFLHPTRWFALTTEV